MFIVHLYQNILFNQSNNYDAYSVEEKVVRIVVNLLILNKRIQQYQVISVLDNTSTEVISLIYQDYIHHG